VKITTFTLTLSLTAFPRPRRPAHRRFSGKSRSVCLRPDRRGRRGHRVLGSAHRGPTWTGESLIIPEAGRDGPEPLDPRAALQGLAAQPRHTYRQSREWTSPSGTSRKSQLPIHGCSLVSRQRAGLTRAPGPRLEEAYAEEAVRFKAEAGPRTESPADDPEWISEVCEAVRPRGGQRSRSWLDRPGPTCTRTPCGGQAAERLGFQLVRRSLATTTSTTTSS